MHEGSGGEQLVLDESLHTIADVRQFLCARGETWQQVLGETSLTTLGAPLDLWEGACSRWRPDRRPECWIKTDYSCPTTRYLAKARRARIRTTQRTV